MKVRVDLYNDGIEESLPFDTMDDALEFYNKKVSTGEYEYVGLVIIIKEHYEEV